MARRWSLAVPLVVALLGASYLIGDAWASPYSHSPASGIVGITADLGVPRVVDIPVNAQRRRLAVHLVSARAVGNGGAVPVEYVMTGERLGLGGTSIGFPLRCVTGADRAVRGALLTKNPNDTVLRMIITPAVPGTFTIKGVDLAWRAGLFHGSEFVPLSVTIHARARHAADGCSGALS